MTHQQVREAKGTIREELEDIAADMTGFKYDLAEARKSIFAAKARKTELRAKLAELHTHARVRSILLRGIA